MEFCIKIKPMEKVDVDNVIAIEESIRSHHRLKGFLSEVSNDFFEEKIFFCI